jgi:hypothetical protein
MGTVIKFPLDQRMAHEGSHLQRPTEAATIIILPVIRIDRHRDEPSGGVASGGTGTAPGRGRRRRNSRS